MWGNTQNLFERLLTAADKLAHWASDRAEPQNEREILPAAPKPQRGRLDDRLSRIEARLDVLAAPVAEDAELDKKRHYRFVRSVERHPFTRGALLLFAGLAAVGLFSFLEERSARQDERIARHEERIARAWLTLSAPTAGNSGKAEALEYLAENGQDISGADLGAFASRRVRLDGLSLVNGLYSQVDFSYAVGRNIEFDGVGFALSNFRGADLIGVLGAHFSRTDLSQSHIDYSRTWTNDVPARSIWIGLSQAVQEYFGAPPSIEPVIVSPIFAEDFGQPRLRLYSAVADSSLIRIDDTRLTYDCSETEGCRLGGIGDFHRDFTEFHAERTSMRCAVLHRVDERTHRFRNVNVSGAQIDFGVYHLWMSASTERTPNPHPPDLPPASTPQVGEPIVITFNRIIAYDEHGRSSGGYETFDEAVILDTTELEAVFSGSWFFADNPPRGISESVRDVLFESVDRANFLTECNRFGPENLSRENWMLGENASALCASALQDPHPCDPIDVRPLGRRGAEDVRGRLGMATGGFGN